MDDERTDEELVEAWRRGDGQAVATLLLRHRRSVHRFLRNKVNEDELGDLEQLASLECLKHPARYERRKNASFKTYLIGIARHVLLKHLRDDAQRRRYEQPEDIEERSVAEMGQTPSQVLAMKDDQRRSLEALQRLPLKYQMVLELRFWEGLKQREIAEALELPPGTVADRIRRGLHLLRKILLGDS